MGRRWTWGPDLRPVTGASGADRSLLRAKGPRSVGPSNADRATFACDPGNTPKRSGARRAGPSRPDRCLECCGRKPHSCRHASTTTRRHFRYGTHHRHSGDHGRSARRDPRRRRHGHLKPSAQSDRPTRWPEQQWPAASSVQVATRSRHGATNSAPRRRTSSGGRGCMNVSFDDAESYGVRGGIRPRTHRLRRRSPSSLR